MTIHDSGQREEFTTGSVRDRQEGKGRHDLLMTHAIDQLAIHTEEGAKKYSEDNWRLGQPLRQYLASAYRHLNKLMRGETDERHDRALLWNIAAFIETQHMIEQGILPIQLNDLKDYSSVEGFERTVRQPMLEEAEQQAATIAKGRDMGHRHLYDASICNLPPLPVGYEYTGECRLVENGDWFAAGGSDDNPAPWPNHVGIVTVLLASENLFSGSVRYIVGETNGTTG